MASFSQAMTQLARLCQSPLRVVLYGRMTYNMGHGVIQVMEKRFDITHCK